MNANISPSRDTPYLSPKPSKSPFTKFTSRVSKAQQHPYTNTEANPELGKPIVVQVHHIGAHHSRNEFVVPPLRKKVEQFIITTGYNSQPHTKHQFVNNQPTKSPKFLMVDKTSMTNPSRKMSYNQQSIAPYAPKVNDRKSQLVNNSDCTQLQLPQTRGRKLSYQVSTQCIQTQAAFTQKQIHSFWPMSPSNDITRRQSDLLPGMASGRHTFFQDCCFEPKNNENGNSNLKIGTQQAKNFFPSFKNTKLRKNSQNQNNLQKDAKTQQLPSFLLKKMHKKNEDVKPQQNVQILKEEKQKSPLSLSSLSYQNSVKQKKFSLKDFMLIKQLGEGKFGKVLLVKQKATGFIFAMKVFKKSQIQVDNFIEQFIREMKIQLFLNHPNIIKMYGYFDDLSFFYILLEAAIEGTMYSFLASTNNNEKHQSSVPSITEGEKKKQGLTGLTLKQAAVIMYQICSGVNYLHSHNIIHRDLKPQNVVIHDKTIKLCDFGWSVFKGSQMRTTFCGTPLYLCPQLITGEEYDQKVDIWAIGIMLYEFLIGPNPFNIKQEADLANIIHQQLSLDKNNKNLKKKLDSTVIDFINGCLNKDPIERLDIREIVNHEFFMKHCPQLITGGSNRHPRNSSLGMGEVMK